MSRGGITIVRLVEHIGDTFHVVGLGIARCHPGESFSYKTGAAIALRRALHGVFVDVSDLYTTPRKKAELRWAVIPKRYWEFYFDSSWPAFPVRVRRDTKDSSEWIVLDNRVTKNGLYNVTFQSYELYFVTDGAAEAFYQNPNQYIVRESGEVYRQNGRV